MNEKRNTFELTHTPHTLSVWSQIKNTECYHTYLFHGWRKKRERNKLLNIIAEEEKLEIAVCQLQRVIVGQNIL